MAGLRRRARFEHAVALFGRAEAAARSGRDGRALYEQTAKLLQDFLWDYEKGDLTAPASLVLGRAHAALGDAAHAATYLEQAWETGVELDPVTARRAALALARTLVDRAEAARDRKYDEDALRALDRLGRAYPGAAAEDVGRECRIEEALARIGVGEAARGVAILEEVFGAASPAGPAPQGGNASPAGAARRLAAFDLRALGLPPRLQLRIAEALAVQGRRDDALRVCRDTAREAAGDATGASDADYVLPACWFRMGEWLLAEGRLEEAFVAFEAVTRLRDRPNGIRVPAMVGRVRAVAAMRRSAEGLGPESAAAWRAWLDAEALALERSGVDDAGAREVLEKVRAGSLR